MRSMGCSWHHFLLQLDPSDTIKVAVRVRPLLDYERTDNRQETVQIDPDDPTAIKVSHWPLTPHSVYCELKQTMLTIF